jgi:phage baseplate assembly protein W
MATPRATRTYKDLDFDFTAHPVTGDVARKTGDAAIIQSLKGLLQTGAYERLWQPRIHSKLREHLFEPIDNITSSAIEAEIRTTVGKFEPRVDLIEVNVTPEYDSNGYSVTMSFFIVNRTDPITITFFLERIR